MFVAVVVVVVVAIVIIVVDDDDNVASATVSGAFGMLSILQYISSKLAMGTSL